MKTKSKLMLVAILMAITIGFVALSLTGCNPDINSDLDYVALDTAISSANATKAGISISADGNDVVTAVQWVTRSQMDAFDNAIDSAEMVRSNATKQSEINNAVTSLYEAVIKFNNAKAYGAQTVTQETLNELIQEAINIKTTAVVSIDGSDVDPNNYWITQDEMAVLEGAILMAQNPGSNLADACSVLYTALANFEMAKKEGIQSGSPELITSTVINIDAAQKGQQPNTEATAEKTVNFEIGMVSWLPEVDGVFLGSTEYTASVTLTANEGYEFADTFTATIDGHTANIDSNDGTEVTLSYTWTTGEKTVVSFTIHTQPKLAYTHGEELDLSGLIITLDYDAGLPENIPFTSFSDHNIETIPANGTTLVHTAHNDETVKVKYGSMEQPTTALTINKAASVFDSPSAINTTYAAGMALANVPLPSGYAWVNPETALTVSNNGQQFDATYTESENHNPASGKITVNIAKAKIEKPALIVDQFTFNGSPRTVTLTATNAAYALSGSIQTNAGDYTATVTLNNTANYEWADGTTDPLPLEWSIAKAAGPFPVHPAVTGVLCTMETQTLASVMLNTNYAWADPTTALSTGTANYAAIYTDPSGNYLDANGIVSVTMFEHNWGEWVETNSPTITEDGKETRTCSHNLNHIETRPLYATGTPGLSYQLINNNTAYRVRRGSLGSAAVHIPDYHRPNANAAYLPVTEIGSLTDSFSTAGAFSQYSSLSPITTVTIGNNITSIGNYAFNNNTNLESVTIGNSVTTIGNYAFFQCSNLTDIIMPNSVTTIGENAFRNCTNLESVTLPNNPNFTTIENGAFVSCRSLESITIPNSVTTIGDFAFMDCYSLESITIPNSVTTIGELVFRDSKITSVIIPNSVTSIGYGAFYSPFLTTINIVPGNSAYTVIDGVLYTIDVRTLIQYPAKKSGTIFTIPNSVTTIGNYAFAACNSLTSITIPNNVTSIGVRAFAGCTSLTNVTIGNSVATIGSYAFINCPIFSITIPNSVTTIEDNAFSGTLLNSVTFQRSNTDVDAFSFFGDLQEKYLAGGSGTYMINGDVWTRQ